MLQTVVLLHIFVENIAHFKKDKYLFEIEIFCHIIKTIYCHLWSI